tara:strand:+ start:11137 stop:11808 length:672 start_codon:yes stop_codon:yes gene_type:complete
MNSPKNRKRDFPAWHPEFRIPEELPDIKAVRTDFLINIGSIGLALVLLFGLLYREATISSLEGDLDSLRSEERRIAPDNKEVITLYTRFMLGKQVYDDLDKFYDAPINLPRFLYDISEIRPANISFDEIAYQEIEESVREKKSKSSKIERAYRISLRGQTRDLKEIEALKEALDQLPYLREVEALIREGSNPRNPMLNTFGFSIEVRFQPAKEKKEKGGKKKA